MVIHTWYDNALKIIYDIIPYYVRVFNPPRLLRRRFRRPLRQRPGLAATLPRNPPQRLDIIVNLCNLYSKTDEIRPTSEIDKVPLLRAAPVAHRPAVTTRRRTRPRTRRPRWIRPAPRPLRCAAPRAGTGLLARTQGVQSAQAPPPPSAPPASSSLPPWSCSRYRGTPCGTLVALCERPWPGAGGADVRNRSFRLPIWMAGCTCPSVRQKEASDSVRRVRTLAFWPGSSRFRAILDRMGHHAATASNSVTDGVHCEVSGSKVAWIVRRRETGWETVEEAAEIEAQRHVRNKCRTTPKDGILMRAISCGKQCMVLARSSHVSDRPLASCASRSMALTPGTKRRESWNEAE